VCLCVSVCGHVCACVLCVYCVCMPVSVCACVLCVSVCVQMTEVHSVAVIGPNANLSKSIATYYGDGNTCKGTAEWVVVYVDGWWWWWWV